MSRFVLRQVSRLAITAWVAVALGPTLIPHGDALDFACSDESWGVPAPSAEIEQVQVTAGDGHCVVCHLQRAVGGAFAAGAGALLAPRSATMQPAKASQAELVHRAPDVPARAPPTVSL